jgi:RHS repeat-associated protein
VLVRSSVDADVTIQTAEFDGVGRRIKKTVAGSGDLDGTTVYFYEGQKICETRDGSGNMVAQFIHGTQYIDELVMMRAADKGDLYVHQDANFNVIGVTDLGGSLIERYVLEPYGELTMHQLSSYGDRDGDGDVDATDKGTPGTTCTGTVTGACRILDLDFDGDYDSSDATLFDNLDSGDVVHPGRRFSALGQHFGHQGLWLDAEAGQYQNRARWYGPSIRRFGQRDPLAFVGQSGAGFQDGANLQEYERNNPLTLIDPRGTCCGYGPPRPGWSGWLCCDANGDQQICIDPAITDPVMRRCIREHEEQHFGYIACDCGDPPGPNMAPAPYTPGGPQGEGSECFGFRAELRCIEEHGDSDHDDHRKYLCCMVAWLCDRNYPQQLADLKCSRNQLPEGHPGCD